MNIFWSTDQIYMSKDLFSDLPEFIEKYKTKIVVYVNISSVYFKMVYIKILSPYFPNIWIFQTNIYLFIWVSTRVQ